MENTTNDTRPCVICKGIADLMWDVLDPRGKWWQCRSKACGVCFQDAWTE